MEPQPDLSTLSDLELRTELGRWEKRRNDLLAAFPYLGDGSASLTAQYAGGPEWNDLAETKSQIKKLKLELIRRGQTPGSTNSHSERLLMRKPEDNPAEAVESKPKRGPQAKMGFHRSVAAAVRPYGSDWKEHLKHIAETLDRQKKMTPAPLAWAKRDRPSRSWARALEYYPEVVVKVIAYSLKMAAKDITEKSSPTFANSR